MLELGHAARVSAEVVNVEGRRVAVLTAGAWFEPGLHRIDWNGCDRRGSAMPAGNYFIRVEAGGESRTWKAVLIR